VDWQTIKPSHPNLAETLHPIEGFVGVHQMAAPNVIKDCKIFTRFAYLMIKSMNTNFTAPKLRMSADCVQIIQWVMR
jgi:hypothetical protein